MCCWFESIKTFQRKIFDSPFSIHTSHTSSGTIRRLCTSTHMSQPDANAFYWSLRSVLKYFPMSPKISEFLNQVLENLAKMCTCWTREEQEWLTSSMHVFVPQSSQYLFLMSWSMQIYTLMHQWSCLAQKVRNLQMHFSKGRTIFVVFIGITLNLNPLRANLTKWSNTLKQFVGKSRRIVWVCLIILWVWRLKG